MNAVLNPLKKRTVGNVARDCLAMADGDFKEADRLFKKELANDDTLYKELLTPLIDRAVWDAITAAGRATRTAYKSHGHAPNADNTSGLARVANQHLIDWLSYPLRGGKRLGDATIDDLKVEIENHIHLSNENRNMANFYSRIIDSMGDKKFVKDALTSDKIDSINQEVRHG